MNINYANAYKEVLVIINHLIKEDYDKIPKEYIEFLKSNCNNDYKFEYDNSKTFGEQDLLDDTRYILFGVFEKFGATEKQKIKIKSFRANYNNKLEEQKREKYNPDDIFKNKIYEDIQEKNNNVQLIEYKELSIFQKILNKILDFFRKL